MVRKGTVGRDPLHIQKKKGRNGMAVSMFIQSVVNGLNQGAIYALIALGYTMVYGILRMINFAHGDFIMVGAYTIFYTAPLMVSYGMPALFLWGKKRFC